jgi:hypothetical protein
MKRLLWLPILGLAAVAGAHHSPDHVTDAVAPAPPPDDLGYLVWIFGPLLLLMVVGVVRALRRRRGQG